MFINQKTIKKEIKLFSISLHKNKESIIMLKPAEINMGINIIYKNNNYTCSIPCNFLFIKKAILSTNLTRGKFLVQTVEHLLSAIFALGIDNIIIKINSLETPIIKGNSIYFLNLILYYGFIYQNTFKRFIKIIKTVKIKFKDKFAILYPYNGFKISLKLDSINNVINKYNKKKII